MSTRALLACGAAAGPLLAVVLLGQALWNPGYELGNDPISSLSLGPYGWVQIATFVLVGALVASLGVGLRRVRVHGRLGRVAGALLLVMGVGLAGIGVFIVDPVAWHGVLHDVSTGVAINGGVLAVLVLSLSWWQTGREGRAVLGLVTALACAVLGWQADSGTIALRHTGVVVVLGAWLTATARWLLRDSTDGP